jgi:hypothetical protein
MGLFKIKPPPITIPPSPQPPQPPALKLKHYMSFISPHIGTNDQFSDKPETIEIPQNAILIGIDVVYDGLCNDELQTTKLVLTFDDGSSGETVIMAAGGRDAPFTIKPIVAYNIYEAAGGSFEGEPYTVSKNIVKIDAFGKTNKDMPCAMQYVIARYYVIS